MARKPKPQTTESKIDTYIHSEERLNNPPAGFAPFDEDGKDTEYTYDPNIDPSLEWAGKAERTSFEVPLVSLHVHENISPYKVITTARKKGVKKTYQMSIFDTETLLDRKERLEFYKHKRGWSNRLIAGDSLLVMNSLLEKEGMAGKVQMVYVDPPYGISYGSNFQPFVNKKDVREKDEDLTQEPEMIKAFRDTWELGIHSYLTYIRDRLLLCRELLADEGSVFVQISDENLHYIRCICDEVFGRENFVTIIAYATTSGFDTNSISRAGDYIVWYAKKKDALKYRQLFEKKTFGEDPTYSKIETDAGERMSIPEWEKKNNRKFDYSLCSHGYRIFKLDNIVSQGASAADTPFEFEGKTFRPKSGSHWKTDLDGMKKLAENNRLMVSGRKNESENLNYVRYFDDFPYKKINNMWTGTTTGGFNQAKIYVVQTSDIVIQKCMLMTTDPGDLVLDITCGSGTTAYVAEKWGRRWITCDTSRISIALTRQRILTASFDYYKLLYPEQGISGGLVYESAPHIKLQNIAKDEPPEQEYFVDRPAKDDSKARVSGPFTMEAIPSPTVHAIDEGEDASSTETSRQSEWRDELKATGVITRSGKKIEFTRVEPLSGTRYIQAIGETMSLGEPQRVAIHFGDVSHALDKRAVDNALDEVQYIRPTPDIVLFCAFQFDSEAADFIDGTKWPGVQLLKVQMNTDLLTEDLKKKRSSNQSFWLIGQPDVVCERDDDGKYVVRVCGFDYYNVETGGVESGGSKRISMWMLDTSYDGLTLNPSQIFFPMAGQKDGWSTLAKTLGAELDPDLIEHYRGVSSIPFEVDGPTKIAVKIIDDRGIESMKVISLEGED